MSSIFAPTQLIISTESICYYAGTVMKLDKIASSQNMQGLNFWILVGHWQKRIRCELFCAGLIVIYVDDGFSSGKIKKERIARCLIKNMLASSHRSIYQHMLDKNLGKRCLLIFGRWCGPDLQQTLTTFAHALPLYLIDLKVSIIWLFTRSHMRCAKGLFKRQMYRFLSTI